MSEVIFHACAQTTHVDRLLPYLDVKVRSPTKLLTPSFVAIGLGVLLPGVVEIPTFPILRAMATAQPEIATVAGGRGAAVGGTQSSRCDATPLG